MRQEGLFPVSSSNSLCLGPSVYKGGKFVRRQASVRELLRLFDVPLALDAGFLQTQWERERSPMPFETALSSDIWAACFRVLWGDDGGYGSVTDSNQSEDNLLEAETSSSLRPGDSGPLSAHTMAEADEDSASSTTESTKSSRSLPHPIQRSCGSSATSSDSSSVSSLESVTSIDVPNIPSEVSFSSSPTPFDDDSDKDSLMPRKKGTIVSTSTQPTENLSFCSGSTTSSTSSVPTVISDEIEFDLENVYEYEEASDTGSVVSGFGESAGSSLASDVTVKVATREMLDAAEDAYIGKKAARSDDAEVPVYLWNMRIHGFDSEALRDKAVKGFRLFGMRLFLLGIRQDCAHHLRQKYGLDQSGTPKWMNMPRRKEGKLTKLGWELEGMRNMLWHVTETNWFEYLCGSKTYYFRYPIRYHSLARDGCKVYFEKPGPSTKQAQPKFPDPKVRTKVKEKVMKVVKRKYMVGTTVPLSSLIKYFAVPKGEDDIRIVYDATASGLNECVWAPSFWLPTVDSMLRALDADSWMADRDIGDMFLNFELHKSAWPFAGVDLKPIAEDDGKVTFVRWYHWVRNLMGFKPSPYGSIKTALVAEEVVRGDRHDPTNPYQWDRVNLNLPGPGFNPTKAWVSKIRKDELVACDLFTFVDDERITGPTEELTWQAGHTLGAKQSYLGIQDAARKVGPCSQTPRAWAGAVVHVVPRKGVCVLTSEEKWRKLKSIVAKWLAKVKAGEEYLDHKDLLSDRGFLVYVTRSYPGMIPYLKGFHLTIEMWRGNRDADGWKFSSKELSASLVTDQQLGPVDDEEAEMAYLMRKKVISSIRAPISGKTPPAPRLLDDLKALEVLTAAELPPLRVVRPAQVVQVVYGFVDASGTGLGSTVQGFCVQKLSEPVERERLRYRVGVWGKDEETESSNYRELANLVMTVETEAEAGRLDNTEFFLFTDNSTAESAFYKGSSTSKNLHALVLRLRQLELRHGLILHVIHVSGKRMIAQGTDGCSRGVLLEGVMAGEDMLSFVDLAKSAFERSPKLLDWIQSWCLDSGIQPLKPEDWFERGHGIVGGKKDRRGVWIPEHEPSGQTHLWAPPPAAADAALEQLLLARHKRTDTYHIIAIPRLFIPRWRRLFHKVVDVNFSIPPGCDFWPSNMFEPLWIGIVLPFYRHSPWQLGRAPLLVDLGRDLHSMCQEGGSSAGHLLRKLCKLPRRLAKLSPSVARAVLRMPGAGSVSNGNSQRRRRRRMEEAETEGV